MNQDDLKRACAIAAMKYVEPDSIIGVGTGSTVNYFIEALAERKNDIDGAVASSIESEKRLKEAGIRVLDLNSVSEVSVYIDGADEANHYGYLIKGGGGALTREKIVAKAARKFVCIFDESKIVNVLGRQAPLPLEVIPMARSLIGREMVKRHATPVLRENFTTDNGNIIIDVHNLDIMEPMQIESELNALPGVVENGIFALRPADVMLVGAQEGVKTLMPDR